MTPILPIRWQQINTTGTLSGQPVEVGPKLAGVEDLVACPTCGDNVCQEGCKAVIPFEFGFGKWLVWWIGWVFG